MGGRLVLATRNEHKRREFMRLLGGSSSGSGLSSGSGAGGWELEILPDGVELPPEDGHTFAENALAKARAAAGATGWASIADDSGIEAGALDGRPGVRSARYAGEHATDVENLDKLLREAPAGSPLRYVCAIAYVGPTRARGVIFEGFCTGTLASDPKGEGGFGYDPAFVLDDRPGSQTMAQLTDEEKDEISHRGRAARKLLEWLDAEGSDREGSDREGPDSESPG
jgi:XTP/dITP diphosphohydrolase